MVEPRKKKKRPRPEHPLPIKWEFGPDIPTEDFFAGRAPDDAWSDVIDTFIAMVEEGDFLTWEAVVAREQGVRLTRRQHSALNRLIAYSDCDVDVILYVNDVPRPTEPWHVILNKIVPHLLIDPFRTFDVHYEEQLFGWRNLVECLAQYGGGLSLPPGVADAVEVVPADLRHRLWLQDCFDPLAGLGQDAESTLEDRDQHYRINEFIGNLRDHFDTVHYLDLTLVSLLTRVILPEKERPIFVKAMMERLGVKTATDRILKHLIS